MLNILTLTKYGLNYNRLRNSLTTRLKDISIYIISFKCMGYVAGGHQRKNYLTYKCWGVHFDNLLAIPLIQSAREIRLFGIENR